ncbi:exopolyphosphatase [Planctomycetota bacterium]
MRLLTRSDFDGLVCAVLLVEADMVDHWTFCHPKDLQDGAVEVASDDVLANVPFVPGCGMWFDHHASEAKRLELAEEFSYVGLSRPAPSAAQVIWDYFRGDKTFGEHLRPLLKAVNKTDSGRLTAEEILAPSGWILLSFVMDPRTGLGRFKDYKISNYQLMEDLIGYCRTMTAEEVLDLDDVRERIIRYAEHQEPFREMLQRCSEVRNNVVVTNLLNEETVYCGNRFVIYALFPEQNIEVRILQGREDKQNVVIACGHSILNRKCRTDVGRLMLEYGGGGHVKVGTCQVAEADWERVLDEILERIQAKG